MKHWVYFVFLITLSLPAAAAQLEVDYLNLSDPRYRSCSVNSDCTSYQTRCGAPVAVNKISKPELDSWQYSQPVNCSVSKVNPNNVPTCVSGFCAFRTMTGTRALEERNPRYCESASDCQAVSDPCGNIGAYNIRHAAQKDADMKAANPQGICPRVMNKPLMRVECRMNRCNALVDNYADANSAR